MNQSELKGDMPLREFVRSPVGTEVLWTLDDPKLLHDAQRTIGKACRRQHRVYRTRKHLLVVRGEIVTAIKAVILG